MPLFTFLSGVVYGYRPVTQKTNLKYFFTGKSRRLLIPLVFVGGLHYIFERLVVGVWYDPLTLFVKPFSYFWYLQALFLIFILISIAEKLKMLVSPKLFGLVFVSSIFWFYFANSESQFAVEWFSASLALEILPFFVLGLAFTRFQILKNLRLSKNVGYLILGISIIMMIGLGNSTVAGSRISIIGLVVGALACIGLLASDLNYSPLRKIGLRSFEIYLFHGFAVTTSRELLMRLGINTILLHLAFGMLLASLPIFIKFSRRVTKQNTYIDISAQPTIAGQVIKQK